MCPLLWHARRCKKLWQASADECGVVTHTTETLSESCDNPLTETGVTYVPERV